MTRQNKDLSDDEFAQLQTAVASVFDPEVPALTIDDLGILRTVERRNHTILVTITPTYSGCPALHLIEQQIQQILDHAGVDSEVRTQLKPEWTTVWMSDEGRVKLTAVGIAPPQRSLNSDGGVVVIIKRPVGCPRCGSKRTEVVSNLGSTACQASYRCLQCLEPFDYFKEL
ncbi:MAG: phenylacetate-CoA oxygenase subunit PaaJ [Actinomycetia bacterium]|nr:phenylacetate-CoA oxygenase subunit PaaJ [Actinomycetes bacterium]MCP4222377.1 phenylacetate-CoA oxygenase subunit PaaJ [Actinomycetes bacterium]MCP5030237.1 phenylacetate-CoA oxygenase subunit PaaJ [Actinomycetes bacterium]